MEWQHKELHGTILSRKTITGKKKIFKKTQTFKVLETILRSYIKLANKKHIYSGRLVNLSKDNLWHLSHNVLSPSLPVQVSMKEASIQLSMAKKEFLSLLLLVRAAKKSGASFFQTASTYRAELCPKSPACS